MNKRILILDYLRGYSIFTIICYHYLYTLTLPSIVKNAINFGGTGVHMFIFISGFGLYISYSKKPLPYIYFLKKRFLKVYIPASIAVSIIAFLSIFVRLYDFSVYAYLGHLFLYKMFDNSIISSYGIQLWFISLIFQFYFVFPLIFKLQERLSDIWFLATSLIISLAWSSIVAYTGKSDMRVWNSFFLQYLWEFSLGMYSARRYLKDHFKFWNISSSVLILSTVLAISLFALMVFKLGTIGKIFNDIPALISYAGIALFIYKLIPEWVKSFFYYTGNISFNLYLYHILILNLVVIYFHKAMEINLILSMIISYTVAYLIYTVNFREIVWRASK